MTDLENAASWWAAAERVLHRLKSELGVATDALSAELDRLDQLTPPQIAEERARGIITGAELLRKRERLAVLVSRARADEHDAMENLKFHALQLPPR